MAKKKTAKKTVKKTPVVKKVAVVPKPKPEPVVETEPALIKVEKISAKKPEPPPSSPRVTPPHITMTQERYLETAKRLCYMRRFIGDEINGFFKGTDTGCAHTLYYKKPAPPAIMALADKQLMTAVNYIDNALAALKKQWLLDYPNATIPEEVDYEFKL